MAEIAAVTVVAIVEETAIGTETVTGIAKHATAIGTEIEIADVTEAMIVEVIEIDEVIATVMRNGIGTGTGGIARTEMESDGTEAKAETERGDGMNRKEKVQILVIFDSR